MHQQLNSIETVVKPVNKIEVEASRLCIDHLSLQLEGRAILSKLSTTLPATGITALIGPSGAGKSTLLRCLNRLYEQWQGDITWGGQSILNRDTDLLRRQIGLIGQKPAVFPCSIRDNVIFGLSRQQRRAIADEEIHEALKQAALWQEVEHRLGEPAEHLSVGQQQRLCLARALILKPDMLMLDEPTSALDPRSRDIIERSMMELGKSMPLLWVSHDLDQARRISNHILFMCDGKLIEQSDTESFFNHPKRIESREFMRWSVCDC
ncbi:MAG: ATP-binding cassette domain-containing protein [Mariprofundus sp.]|nr:ATP-binding cassette domain-containing protein [Mariprofundus sp.]